MGKPVVEVSTDVEADAEAVWRTLTTPSLIREHFVGTDVRGWCTHHGELRHFDPPRELSYAQWSESGGAPAGRRNEQLVTFRIEPHREQTRLTVAQLDLGDASELPELVKAEFRKNWETVLAGLKWIAEREVVAL